MRFFCLAFCLTISMLVFAQNSLQTLNSSYDEQNAALSPDGLTMYFTIANHPQNVGGKRDPGDIWLSRWQDDNWSAPVHGGTVINDRGYNGVAGFTGDGSQVFLLCHYGSGKDGVARTQGIAVSRLTGSEWSRPENIRIPYFQNKSAIVGGYLSPDSRIFVYSAETYGSYGVEDIFVSLKNDRGEWSAPRNLGSRINSQFQELSPSISSDGSKLYFSSNGREGFGSFDVYAATRLDDTWTNWSEPVNLGPEINSAGRELFYRHYEAIGKSYYTSTTNSDGYGDIRIFVGKDFEPTEPVAMQVTVDPEPVPEEHLQEPASEPEGIKVFGKITDAKTGEPVQATVTFAGASREQEITSSHSGYEYYVGSPADYRIIIKANGYISAMERLDVTDYTMKSLEMNFQMQPLERGTTVNLRSVLFVQSKTELLPESFPELDVVVSFLKENPGVSIELAGHTDNRGVHRDNVELSQARVEKVKAYLVSKGISDNRISGKGYGGSHPIASNDQEETRKLNRRVEFVIKRL